MASTNSCDSAYVGDAKPGTEGHAALRAHDACPQDANPPVSPAVTSPPGRPGHGIELWADTPPSS